MAIKMKLKELYLKLYNAVFSVPFFKKLLKIPFVEKLLQYEIVSYLVFGVLTTLVNFIVYGLANLIAGGNYEEKVLFSVGAFNFLWIYVSQALAWVMSVIFAYITNKLFVFESSSWKRGVVVKEVVSFFGARILSFILFEELVFMLLAGALHINSWIAKIIISVMVVIFNFVASKLVIFKKKKTSEGEEQNA